MCAQARLYRECSTHPRRAYVGPEQKNRIRMGGINMRLRGVCLAVVTVAMLLTAVCAAQATVLSLDFAYWYWGDAGEIATIFNPTSGWLQTHLGSIVIKIQQTVYSKDVTAAVLKLNGENPPVPEGFLFSYTVTNINWMSASPGGVKAFGVDWGPVTPLLVTTSQSQTPPQWVGEAMAFAPGFSGPVWYVDPSESTGIKIGSTVGGFWAVSPTDNDGRVPAAAMAGAINTDNLLLLQGETTGPWVPEPSSVLALVFGAGALGITLVRRRR
jgi:hypothetical protein